MSVFTYSGCTIGQLGGRIAPGAVVVVGGAPPPPGPALSKTVLMEGDSITVGDAQIDGPCTVEVRDGKLFIDGKERPAAVAARLEVTVVFKSKPSKEVHVTGGSVVFEKGATSVQATNSRVTVDGAVTTLVATGSTIEVKGAVDQLTSTGGSVKCDKIGTISEGSVVSMRF